MTANLPTGAGNDRRGKAKSVNNSWSETNSEHALVVDEFWIDNEEGDLDYSLSVVHLGDCVIHGPHTENEDPFYLSDYTCWIGNMVNAIGMEDIIRCFEYPYDDGFDWLVMASALTGKPIRIKYSAGGGYDYWGEYDEDFEIQLVKENHG